LDGIDTFFTTMFTIELAINMYAHLLWDFLENGWSLFDFLIVSISLLGLVYPALANISVFRLMRAFRVIRIFGRLRSVRSIINALTASIVPVCNAFFIVAIIIALFSIVGVTFFEDDAPEEFGNLSRSIISMFRIAGGETWSETMPTVYVQDDGTEYVNWKFGCFIILYVLVMNWTLLQVGVAVLLGTQIRTYFDHRVWLASVLYEKCRVSADPATFLWPDNFIGETSREAEAAAKSKVEEQRMLSCMRNVLDPLLKVIATDYVDEANFQQHTRMLWNRLVTAVVVHESRSAQKGGTPTELTREQVCVGFRSLDFESMLHFSHTDFDVLTEHGDEFSHCCLTFVLVKTCTGGASTLTI